MRRQAAIYLGTTLLLAAAGGAQAQTIYPINRAEILAGARFDLKVEFPNAPPEQAVRVTINGQPADAVLGQRARFIEHEDGAGHSALWIRDAALSTSGQY